MKIKLYIVTYNNNVALSACLDSLFDSKIPNDVAFECFIINNHSNIHMDRKYQVTIMNNNLRPDFSTGHLARNWNQAIINGFENLNSPACDIVVTCQVDTIFTSDWLSELIEYHKSYCFITMCPGDGFISYTVDAILRIGMWDERFCSIEFQEADYFLRALIYNKQWSSINDFHHGRVLNPILNGEFDYSLVFRKNTDMDIHKKSTQWSAPLLKLLQSKYDREIMLNWDAKFIKHSPKVIRKLITLYPYFENKILDFDQKYEW